MPYTTYNYKVNTGNASTTIAIIEQDGTITTTDDMDTANFTEDQFVQVTHNGSSGSVYLRVIPAGTAKTDLVSSVLFQEVLTTDSPASRTTEPIRVPPKYKLLILGSGTIACNVSVYQVVS